MFKSLGLCPPNKYKVDLSNEVLNIDFGQEAAKISVVKVGGQKKRSANAVDCRRSGSNPAAWQIFFSSSNFDL